MLLLVGVAMFFTARASASDASVPPQSPPASSTPEEQAALVAEGEALFSSTTAWGQQPSQGPLVAGLVISCQTCHNGPAFTDNRNHIVGPTATREAVVRNTPHLLRLKGTSPFAWDGRNETLQAQIRGAVTSPLEMNGTREPTARELDALAAFVETLDAPDATPGVDFDPVLAEKGKLLFESEQGRDPSGEFSFTEPVSCATCHAGEQKTDNEFHRILMPFGDPVLDPGAMNDDGSIRGFETPVLRGLRFTAPYFHEGLGGDPTSLRTAVNDPPRPALLETVAFYNGRFAFQFTPEEQLALVEYLMSL